MNKFLALSSILFTTALILDGAVLCILKLFGFPFFFEGIVIFSLGALLSVSLTLVMLFQKIIDTFTEVLKTPANLSNLDGSLSENTKTISIIHDENGNVEMDSNLSEEEMKILENTPGFKNIMNNINNGFTGLSNINLSHPFKKELKDYNKGELEVMLRAAVELDDFEQAEALKKELDGR